jgi:TPR repeat protein
MNRKSAAWKKYDRDLFIYNCVEAGRAAEKSGDIGAAVKCFEKAAANGSIYAIGELGRIFDFVVKPPRNDRAVYWYRAGVRRGYSSCAWDLAMHYSSLGNKRWYLHWLRVADRMGEPDAPEELSNGKWWRKHNSK